MVDADPRAPGGPVFIVGGMGSGTTLLRLMLDSHPNVAIAPETGFARAYLANKHIPFWRFGGGWYRRLGLTDDEMDERLRGFYDGLFMHYAHAQGKQRWGEKTPNHIWHMDRLANLFPDAVFVGLVRHPGAVVASLKSRFGFSFRRAAAYWGHMNAELLAQGEQLDGRFALCRFEDLVLRPEPTMRELLDWLNEPWSPQVLEHHVVHQQRGTAGRIEGRTRVNDAIDPERASKWRNSLTAKERTRLAQSEAVFAGFFGYDVTDATGLDAWGHGGPRQLLITGEQLEQRHKEAAHQLPPRPAKPAAHRPLKPTVVPLLAKTRRGRVVTRAALRKAAAAGQIPAASAPPKQSKGSGRGDRLARSRQRDGRGGGR